VKSQISSLKHRRSIAASRTTILVAICALTAAAFPQGAQPEMASPSAPLNIKFQDVKWQKIFPDWTRGSPEMSILRVDPKTHATQLLIRVPKGFHVPKHWHTANETHTVITGSFTVECNGQQEELGPGSFNYMPSKMVHQAWTKPNEETVLFITSDAAWDVNWVNGPPKQP
jgi:quercetin dioxygenase-like cupin family protein